MKILLAADTVPTSVTTPAFVAGDAKTLFGDITEIAKGADRVVVNLECALTDSEGRIAKFGPNLKSVPAAVNGLKALGVTDVALSNNHVFDFGIQGLRDTMKTLEDAGLPYMGVGENDTDSRKPYVIEAEGKRVGFINVCEHEYTYALPNRIGANPFDPFITMQDIRELKAECDFVIVIYHGGKEHCRYPSPRLRKLCHAMIRNGADLVVGQHSHCISCYEQYEGGHILYGQGNFHFVRPNMPDCWNDCLALHYDTKTNEVNFTALVSNVDRIHIADEKEAKDIFCGFDKRNKSLKDGTWLDGWKAFCEEMKANYRKAIASAGKEDSTYEDDHFFAHYLDCEAHTDVWRELFKTAHYTNEI